MFSLKASGLCIWLCMYIYKIISIILGQPYNFFNEHIVLYDCCFIELCLKEVYFHCAVLMKFESFEFRFRLCHKF